MEIRHLRYFIEVAEDLNITKAAKRLGISQPPLSRQIKQLEEILGIELLDRSSKQIKLTEAGSIFRVKAQQILSSVDDTMLAMKQISTHGHQWVNIGIVPSTIYGFLPELLRSYRKIEDKVEISLSERMTMDQMNALRTGDIDVGFGRIVIDDPLIKQDIILEEQLVVVLPKNHPLSKRETLKLTDLESENLILYPKTLSPNYTDQISDIFYKHSLRPQVSQIVAGLQTALGLIASGIGYTIVPISVHKMRSGDVTYIPFKDTNITSPVTMNYRKEEKSQVVLKFIKRVKLLSAISGKNNRTFP